MFHFEKNKKPEISSAEQYFNSLQKLLSTDMMSKELLYEKGMVIGEGLEPVLDNLLKLEECLLRPKCPNREKYLQKIFELLESSKEQEERFLILPNLILTIRAVAIEYGNEKLNKNIRLGLSEYIRHRHRNTSYWAHFTVQDLERIKY